MKDPLFFSFFLFFFFFFFCVFFLLVFFVSNLLHYSQDISETRLLQINEVISLRFEFIFCGR